MESVKIETNKVKFKNLNSKLLFYFQSETPEGEVKEETELYSTDEEDIEKGILKLMEDLEKAIRDDSKPHDERRKYLKKVSLVLTLDPFFWTGYKLYIQIHKNRRKFTALQGKARKVIAAAEGNHPDADLDVAEDFASEDENELELLGLKSSRKSKTSVKVETKPSKKKKKKSESEDETEKT